MSAPGVTCIRCLGRIDTAMLEFKQRLDARVTEMELHRGAANQRPKGPPRLCSECFFIVLDGFGTDFDPHAQKGRGKRDG